MSPDLERLLEAYHEKRTAPPSEKPQRAATFERLLADTLGRKPGVSRDEFLNVGTPGSALKNQVYLE